MTNQIQNPKFEKNQKQSPKFRNKKRKDYDLEERTAKFGEEIVGFTLSLPDTPVNHPLIGQIVRSGTSIGANYMEADTADSKKDFRYKIGLCRKESKETMHWLRIIAKANPSRKNECRELWQESREFVLIFSSILKRK